VHASNAARFKQAYRDIAAKVELPGRDDPMIDILSLVHDWLCDERNGQWLMIVDNADDDQVFCSPYDDLGGVMQGAGRNPEAAALAKFLPQSANGWILVTSRNLTAAMSLVGPKHNVIQVEPMNEQEALVLLKSKVQVDETFEGDAKALVKALEGIPLAITHAAAYIAVREPSVTFSIYLALFHESEENQAYLLNSQETRDIRRDPSVSNAVITTWQISFEQIRKTKHEATALLSLMAMFDRQGIPEHMLYEGMTRLQFEEAVAPLSSFSLIKVQTKDQSSHQPEWRLFEMHSLVQLATKKWLTLNGEVKVWQKASLRIMAAAFPNGEPGTWTSCRAFLPHSRKVLGYQLEEPDARLYRAVVASNTAWYLLHMGEYVIAESVERSALIVREEVLGPEHPDTLVSFHRLGIVLKNQGKYEGAEAIHRRVTRTLEEVLGPEHPNTLISINQLGSVLERQGKYEEAEATQRKVMRIGEAVLGPKHPYTLTSVSQLGSVLECQGKYEEAESMLRQAMRIGEEVLGPKHPGTLTSVSQLGSVLERQGKYEEAEAMHRQSMRIREEVLGPKHPDTLTSVSLLGSVLERQGKYEEAEAMHRQLMRIGEEVFGPKHPNTLISVHNLAFLLHQKQHYFPAAELYQRAYDGLVKTLGPQHPTTLACSNHYASATRLAMLGG
jgi:tetratricopeptide (TPR) repeat protein